MLIIFFRLTGVYAFIYFFHSSVWKHFVWGPMNYANLEAEECVKAPWRNFLYINNLFALDEEDMDKYGASVSRSSNYINCFSIYHALIVYGTHLVLGQ